MEKALVVYVLGGPTQVLYLFLSAMPTYIVSYDLRKSGQNYKWLIDRIEAYPHSKILESLWAIKSQYSATELRNDLARFLDDNDGLFIIKSWQEAAWKGITGNSDWLKTNL